MLPIRTLALLPLLGLGVPWGRAVPPTEPVVLHTPHVMGCSLELVVPTGDEALRSAVLEVVLASLEATSRSLDTRAPDSDARRYANGASVESPALRTVLAAYRHWETLSGGAVSARTGALTSLWRDGAPDGREPTEEAIGAARRAGREALSLDALGKAFAAEAAAGAVSRAFPGLPGFLINIGGDIVCRGVDRHGLPWRVGVVSPSDDAHNAEPVERLTLGSGAVVTSGDAYRGFTAGGRSRSHLMDPRTGMPAARLRGATVAARDAVTANALSCALCVLGAQEGLALVERTPGASARVVTRAGEVLRSSRWEGRSSPNLLGAQKADSSGSAGAEAVAPAWPGGMRFEMTLSLSKSGKSPYVAVWVADSAGVPVRSLALWGAKPKYLKELKVWWKDVAKADAARVAALSKPTHKAGTYKLEWDGRDEAGEPVAPGEYTVWIETAQEGVGHHAVSGKITCKGASPAKVNLAACGKSLAATPVVFERTK